MDYGLWTTDYLQAPVSRRRHRQQARDSCKFQVRKLVSLLHQQWTGPVSCTAHAIQLRGGERARCLWWCARAYLVLQFQLRQARPRVGLWLLRYLAGRLGSDCRHLLLDATTSTSTSASTSSLQRAYSRLGGISSTCRCRRQLPAVEGPGPMEGPIVRSPPALVLLRPALPVPDQAPGPPCTPCVRSAGHPPLAW